MSTKLFHEFDLYSSEDRLHGYRPKNLKIARAIVFVGLFVASLLLLATVWTNHQTAVENYHIAHSFVPVH